MDTSKEYIEMCEKAKEIQNIRKDDKNKDTWEWWLSGDYVYIKTNEYIMNVCDVRHCSASTGYFEDDEYCVWLPRQDQLQNIYAEYIGADGYCALIDFGEWHFVILELDELGSDKRIYDTPEQLWLAFVMYEKFNKVWDGKKWIKKND